jgi:LysM repeat protein
MVQPPPNPQHFVAMTLRARLLLSSLSLAAVMAAFPVSSARAQDVSAVLAGMREDIRILDERTRSLTAEIEQLKRDNAALRSQASGSYATVAQLNNGLADLRAEIQRGDQQTTAQLAAQLEKLAKQTQAAIDALAKSPAPLANTPTPNFTDDYPKTGVPYTVQSGDTLASIAQKLNSSVRDIQNANKISDPRALQVGKVIFVPQRQ